MEHIWDEVRVVVLNRVVGSLSVEGGDSVLLMDGIMFVVGLAILDRVLMDGWIYHLCVGRNVLTPSVVMVTCTELVLERSRYR